MITASVSWSFGNLAWIPIVAIISAVIGGFLGAFFGYLSMRLVLHRQRTP
jgi:ABC-type microcin C transport system permease subunit YejE